MTGSDQTGPTVVCRPKRKERIQDPKNCQQLRILLEDELRTFLTKSCKIKYVPENEIKFRVAQMLNVVRVRDEAKGRERHHKWQCEISLIGPPGCGNSRFQNQGTYNDHFDGCSTIDGLSDIQSESDSLVDADVSELNFTCLQSDGGLNDSTSGHGCVNKEDTANGHIFDSNFPDDSDTFVIEDLTAAVQLIISPYFTQIPQDIWASCVSNSSSVFKRILQLVLSGKIFNTSRAHQKYKDAEAHVAEIMMKAIVGQEKSAKSDSESESSDTSPESNYHRNFNQQNVGQNLQSLRINLNQNHAYDDHDGASILSIGSSIALSQLSSQVDRPCDNSWNNDSDSSVLLPSPDETFVENATDSQLDNIHQNLRRENHIRQYNSIPKDDPQMLRRIGNLTKINPTLIHCKLQKTADTGNIISRTNNNGNLRQDLDVLLRNLGILQNPRLGVELCKSQIDYQYDSRLSDKLNSPLWRCRTVIDGHEFDSKLEDNHTNGVPGVNVNDQNKNISTSNYNLELQSGPDVKLPGYFKSKQDAMANVVKKALSKFQKQNQGIGFRK